MEEIQIKNKIFEKLNQDLNLIMESLAFSNKKMEHLYKETIKEIIDFEIFVFNVVRLSQIINVNSPI
jgi:hypothetical protein